VYRHLVSKKKNPFPKKKERNSIDNLPRKLSSPSAYPHLSPSLIDTLQSDYTTLLHSTLSHPSLHPANLSILPGHKSWLLHLDLIVLADAGNILDALFLAARAALWDTKVPRTRSVEYRPSGDGDETTTKASGGIMGGAVKGSDNMDVDLTDESSLDTRHALQRAIDFELEDHWDEGDCLDGRDRWPLCVTLNIVSILQSFLFFPH
jgi:exosome complex component RRP42